MKAPVPLTQDPELKAYLEELPSITRRRDFDRWRSSFLKRYETFLGNEGVGDAGTSYSQFTKHMAKWTKLLNKIQTDVDQGNITVDHTSAMAHARLIEFQKQTTLIAQATFDLTPTTVELEKQMGYTKFQLGALLVRDGFDQYENLISGQEILHIFRSSPIAQVADRQLLEAFDYYDKKFQTFCDIMADLGLYEAMRKAHEMNQLPLEPESESEEESHHHHTSHHHHRHPRRRNRRRRLIPGRSV